VTLDARALRLLVLSAWSVFLLWLWLTDEVLRYLGPRTQWVVAVGGLLLALVALGYGRAGSGEPAGPAPSKTEVFGALALLLPIALAMVLSGSSLGSLAASRKLAGRGVDLAALARLQSGNSPEVTFLDLEAASKDPELARSKEIRPGRAVTLTGFVSRPPDRPGADFELARFYITCCVADSIPVGVTVHPAPASRLAARRDQWLVVTGAIVRDSDDNGYAVRALRTRSTPPPAHPYLSFAS
jgi:putative membrane protein